MTKRVKLRVLYVDGLRYSTAGSELLLPHAEAQRLVATGKADAIGWTVPPLRAALLRRKDRARKEAAMVELLDDGAIVNDETLLGMLETGALELVAGTVEFTKRVTDTGMRLLKGWARALPWHPPRTTGARQGRPREPRFLPPTGRSR